MTSQITTSYIPENETGRVNITIVNVTAIHRPDITLNSPDIIFSDDTPSAGDLVNITVTIHNIGTANADNIKIEFLVDGISQANNTLSVSANSTNMTQFSWLSWLVVAGTHNITIIADPENTIDESHEANNNATRQINVMGIFDSQLIRGWNQISTPLEPENNSIESVLRNLEGGVIVTTYDAPTNEWYGYDSNSPEPATLHEIVAGRGYWIYSEFEQNLTIMGYVSIDSIDLYESWNLIGYNSLTDENITTATAGLNGTITVYGYELIRDSWNIYTSGGLEFTDNLKKMTPGKGYWLRSDFNQTWKI